MPRPCPAALAATNYADYHEFAGPDQDREDEGVGVFFGEALALGGVSAVDLAVAVDDDDVPLAAWVLVG